MTYIFNLPQRILIGKNLIKKYTHTTYFNVVCVCVYNARYNEPGSPHLLVKGEKLV